MSSIGQTSTPDRPRAMPTTAVTRTDFSNLLIRMRRRWQLYALLLLPLAYIIIFSYVPILGAQIAFRDFTVAGGIWNSPWVGLANFQRFFNSFQFSRLIVNTITLGLYFLAAGFPRPIILALSLNQVRLP